MRVQVKEGFCDKELLHSFVKNIYIFRKKAIIVVFYVYVTTHLLGLSGTLGKSILKQNKYQTL